MQDQVRGLTWRPASPHSRAAQLVIVAVCRQARGPQAAASRWHAAEGVIGRATDSAALPSTSGTAASKAGRNLSLALRPTRLAPRKRRELSVSLAAICDFGALKERHFGSRRSSIAVALSDGASKGRRSQLEGRRRKPEWGTTQKFDAPLVKNEDALRDAGGQNRRRA